MKTPGSYVVMGLCEVFFSDHEPFPLNPNSLAVPHTYSQSDTLRMSLFLWDKVLKVIEEYTGIVGKTLRDFCTNKLLHKLNLMCNFLLHPRQALQRAGRDFTLIKVLPPGVYQFKFYVDGQWKYSPDLPALADDTTNVNNVLDVQVSSFH